MGERTWAWSCLLTFMTGGGENGSLLTFADSHDRWERKYVSGHAC